MREPSGIHRASEAMAAPHATKFTRLLSYQVAAKHPDHTLEKPKSQIFSSGRLPLLQSWDSRRFSSFRSRFATPCRHAQHRLRNGQQLPDQHN